MGDYLIFSYIKLIVFLTGVQLNKNSNEDTISCTFSRPQVGLFKNELHLWLCNFLASLILQYIAQTWEKHSLGFINQLLLKNEFYG